MQLSNEVQVLAISFIYARAHIYDTQEN